MQQKKPLHLYRSPAVFHFEQGCMSSVPADGRQSEVHNWKERCQQQSGQDKPFTAQETTDCHRQSRCCSAANQIRASSSYISKRVIGHNCICTWATPSRADLQVCREGPCLLWKTCRWSGPSRLVTVAKCKISAVSFISCCTPVSWCCIKNSTYK